MSNTGMSREKRSETAALIFVLLLGAAIIVFGIRLSDRGGPHFLKTAATVTEVDHENRTYTFTYTVNGRQYTGTGTIRSGLYSVGGTRTIYYREDDPGMYADQPVESSSTSLIAGGVIFIAVGAFFLVRRYRY